MNKEEMQKRLRRLEGENKNLGTEIKIALDILAEIAEKPKHRHGDFGVDFDKSKKGNLHFPVLATKKGLDGSLDIIFRDGSPHDGEDITWLGNIFDLLKEWSEPFEYFHSQKGHNYDDDKDFEIVIDINDRRPGQIWLGTCGNSAWYARKDIEEIWHKLGHAIAELKRTQTNK